MIISIIFLFLRSDPVAGKAARETISPLASQLDKADLFRQVLENSLRPEALALAANALTNIYTT
jgi:hypothetical protein